VLFAMYSIQGARLERPRSRPAADTRSIRHTVGLCVEGCGRGELIARQRTSGRSAALDKHTQPEVSSINDVDACTTFDLSPTY